MSPQANASSYLARFTLTLAGGLVSVALSLRLPLVAVSNCLFLVLPGLSSTPLGCRDQLIIWPAYYNLAYVFLTESIIAAKAAGSLTAISLKTLRFKITSDFLRLAISWL